MDGFTLGLRLMKVRQNRGLSQEQVAKKAQLNLNDYIAMEEGKMPKSKEKLEKACKAFDIKIEDLFDSQTNINYNYDNSIGSGIVYNQNNYNQRNNEDIAFMNVLSENLKKLTENIDIINNNIKSLSENLDDNVFKKRLMELLKDYNKNKDENN